MLPRSSSLAPVSESLPPSVSRVQLIELVLPNDANVLGNMLGGRVMHFIDLAGFMAANRHCRKRCVTVAMERLEFEHPVRVGEAIVLDAQVICAGRTSLDVRVVVRSENLLTGARTRTSTAFMTFVAVDEAGRPSPVPALSPETAEERALEADARARRAARVPKSRD